MIRYNSPFVQVIIVGIILLLTSGMFNALNGMGGSGQVDTTVGANANVALYTTFAVGGLIAGAIVNILGPKYSMAIGGSAYALYAGSLLNYNHFQSSEFVITAGAFLGLGAALLWTGQGAIITSYPSEKDKGRYIGIFWAIFNLGAVLGSIIPTALNWNSTSGTVNDGTYVGFLILMAAGALLALALLPPTKVVHDDGRSVAVEKFPSWKSETIAVAKLFLDWRMLCLIPLFISSNWFYAYQFNGVNAFYFNIRTRAFNDVWYWTAQIVGAALCGKFLDMPTIGRRQRAIYGLLIELVFFTATWAGGLAFQLTYERDQQIDSMDLYNNGYVWRVLLFIAYGFNDAIYQCYAYWIMGALTNDTAQLARYNGFYKAIQSAGGAISWRIDATGTHYIYQLIICWSLLTVSIPSAMAVARSIKETNYNSKDVDNEVNVDKQVVADSEKETPPPYEGKQSVV